MDRVSRLMVCHVHAAGELDTIEQAIESGKEHRQNQEKFAQKAGSIGKV